MLLDKIVSYTLIALLLISIIFSIINLIQFTMFYLHGNQLQQQTNQFFQVRRPILIILYSILSIINSLIVLPIIIFTNILQETFIPFYIETFIPLQIRNKYFINNIWILIFIHEIITCLLLLIIAQRAWLLLYDYKYIDAYTSIEWKEIINPGQESKQNKWLKYRKTFGSHSFLSKLIFLCFILIISVLFVLQNFFNMINYSWIVIDIFFAIPLALFILIIITLKIREINDQFKIRRELQYLSIFILILIFSFVVSCIKTFVIEKLLNISKYSYFININILTYISDILYSYFTVYIQCKWLLNESIHYRKSLFIRKPSLRRQSSKTIKLIDVLKSEFGFKSFINHSCKELNVENILFLIEIAQYKATLCKYHVGLQSVSHKFIDVFTDNLHKIILDANSVETVPLFSDHRQSSINAERGGGVQEKLNLNLISDSLKLNDAGSRQEDIFQEFQDNILSQHWLPCARQLKPATKMMKKHKSNISISIDMTNSMNTDANMNKKNVNITNPDTPHLTVNNNNNNLVLNKLPSNSRESGGTCTGSGTGKGSRSRSHSSTATAPPSIQLVRRDSEFEEDITINMKKRIRKKDRHCTVSNKWIFLYSMYLFNKYIARGSEFAVNLPSLVRFQLIHFFNKQMNDCFDNICFANDTIDKLLTENDKNVFKNLVIKTYLYHIFDMSFKYTWSLIRDDTFRRFQRTDEYKKIATNIDNKNQKKSRRSRSPSPSPNNTPKSRNSPNVTPRDSPNLTPKYSPNNSPNNSPNLSLSRHPFKLNNVPNPPKLDEMNEINLGYDDQE